MRDFSEVLRELRTEKKCPKKRWGMFWGSATEISAFMKQESTARILTACLCWPTIFRFRWIIWWDEAMKGSNYSESL